MQIIGVLLLVLLGFALYNKAKPIQTSAADATDQQPTGNDLATPRNGDMLLTQVENSSIIPAFFMIDNKLVEGYINTGTPNNIPQGSPVISSSMGLKATSQVNDPYVQEYVGAGFETSAEKEQPANVVTVTKESFPDQQYLEGYIMEIPPITPEQLVQVKGFAGTINPNTGLQYTLQEIAVKTGLTNTQVLNALR